MEQDPEFVRLQRAVWDADDPAEKWFAVQDLESHVFGARESTTDGTPIVIQGRRER